MALNMYLSLSSCPKTHIFHTPTLQTCSHKLPVIQPVWLVLVLGLYLLDEHMPRTRTKTRAQRLRALLQVEVTGYHSEWQADPLGCSHLTLCRIAMISLAAAIPAFYFIQGTIGTGNKVPGSGNKEIKQSRREGNASTEYRDPRDSGKKTSSVDG